MSLVRRFFAVVLLVAVIGGLVHAATAPAHLVDVGIRPLPPMTASEAGAVLAADGPGVTRLATVRLRGSSLVVRSVEVRDTRHAADMVARLSRTGTLVAFEADQRIHAAASDPRRGEQWGLDQTSFEHAWGQTTGAGVTVAVVDTGVRSGHPDLAGVVMSSKSFLGGGSDPLQDPNGHGTHVAGTVAALTGNGVGVSGAAPKASLMSVQVLDSTGSGWTSNVAAGILWAADNGAKVISLSLSSPDPSSVLSAAVRHALLADVVVVAAAGNAGQQGSPLSYPAAYDGVMSVGAVDSQLARASFSSANASVDLVAPGVGILSTGSGPKGDYQTMSGTSMATPFVAAAAALVRAARPELTEYQVAMALISSARDLGAPGRDDATGRGLVDPLAALSVAAVAPPSSVPMPPAEAPPQTFAPLPKLTLPPLSSPPPSAPGSPQLSLPPLARPAPWTLPPQGKLTQPSLPPWTMPPLPPLRGPLGPRR